MPTNTDKIGQIKREVSNNSLFCVITPSQNIELLFNIQLEIIWSYMRSFLDILGEISVLLLFAGITTCFADLSKEIHSFRYLLFKL